jgi:SpoU rRNA methylase family enzyme
LKKVNPDIVAMAEAEKNGQKNLKLKEIINNIR